MTTGLSSAVAPALMLEREAEMAALAATLDAARAGEGRLVIVEGSAGIGKTRLLSEARALATADEFEVLTARGGELEGICVRDRPAAVRGSPGRSEPGAPRRTTCGRRWAERFAIRVGAGCRGRGGRIVVCDPAWPLLVGRELRVVQADADCGRRPALGG